MPKLRFKDPNRSEFFATLRYRVDNYFKENNISKNANGLMIAKTIFYLGGAALLYGLIMSNLFSPGIMLILAIVLGVFYACIGFNVCHDAIHGSFSSNPKVNKALGDIFNVIGANAYVWDITHNMVHHTYTNIHGHDEDLEIAPGLIRINKDEPVKKHQRYQHIYGFLLYGLASLSWVFRKDYVKFFKKEIGGFENNPPKREYYRLFLYKALHYTIFIVLPLIFLNVTWWQFLIGFLAMHLTAGWVLGLVFQLAHVVEDLEFPEPTVEGNIEEAWAIHQLRTTANFAKDNPFATWFCGGLNMQVEHHLFPKICHIHYNDLSKIVKQTAEEFGLPYYENKTFLKAVRSHYKILKEFAMDAKEMAKSKEPVLN